MPLPHSRLQSLPFGTLLILAAVTACGSPNDHEVVQRDENDRVVLRAHEIEDEDGELVLHGTYVAYHDDGSKRAEGEYRHGVRAGIWTTWHASGGVESRGSYLDNRPEGVWIWRQVDGSIDEDRTGVYENGARTGPWYEEGIRSGRLGSGSIQQSLYERGLRNGRAIQHYESGVKEAEGTYSNGLYSGAWVFWNEDGSVDRERSGWYDAHVKLRDLSTDELTERGP